MLKLPSATKLQVVHQRIVQEQDGMQKLLDAFHTYGDHDPKPRRIVDGLSPFDRADVDRLRSGSGTGSEEAYPFNPREDIPVYNVRLFNTTEGSCEIFPPLPDNDPSECPYCHFSISFRDIDDWACHIFHDILPYMCTFSECHNFIELHPSRKKWESHMASHLDEVDIKAMQCPLCRD